MKLYNTLQHFSATNPVVTVGAFDGVHRGHQQILATLSQKAAELNGQSVVLSFWPHPRHVLEQGFDLKLLNTLDEKAALLQNLGIQHTVLLPFTKEFAALTSKQFVTQILVEAIGVKHLVIGFNHHFGQSRQGNYATIQQLAQTHSFTVQQVEAEKDHEQNISSTHIRNALNTGQVHVARQYLGYPYSLSGTVVRGQQNGRKIGFPTANITPDAPYKLIPAPGVYAVMVNGPNFTNLPGMLNIGTRPTIQPGGTLQTIEVHLPNFEGNLYNQTLTVLFIQHLRAEQQFAGLIELKKQLVKDRQAVIELLLNK